MINEMVQVISKLTSRNQEVTPEILLLQFTVVNACIVENEFNWFLIDTGLENSHEYIIECAHHRFGGFTRPKAIILTHGHFDHIGSVSTLAKKWDVPVYIHELEMPYITGEKDYPHGDASVDEGLIAKMSPSFPHNSIDISKYAKALPSDGSIPEMTGWRWIHTPGHTEGHISLFKNIDKTLIVGDAFTTTKQESFMSVLTQKEEIKGPPAYLTTDWENARNSIEKIKDLNPKLAIPSHGKPMEGEELRKHLDMLSKEFDDIAMPSQGHFVRR